MEFRYRAGDERSRSSPTPPAPATASSGSAAAARVRDGHGGDGTGYHGEISSSATPSATAPPSPASDPDEQRRREAKERIRERILREQVEALQALALETEVRRELMDTVLRSGLARPAPAEGAEARAAPALAMTADSPSPVVLEPQPKANGSASLPAKRKSPGVAAAAASAETSRVSAATSSKKQKPSGLTCTVCDITLTGEKPMQEHLKGKSHMRKATMLAPPVAEHDENEKKNVIRSKANESAAALPAKRENSDVVAAAASTVPASVSSKKQKQDLTCTVCGVTSTSEKSLQDHLRGRSHKRKAAALVLPPTPLEPVPEKEEEGEYTPKKLTMLTNAGEMYGVMQMNGFLLCEVCDIKTADLVTMMCHLEGSKHTSMVKQKQLPGAGNPPPPVPVATGSKKRVKGRRAAPPSSTAVTGAGGDAEEVKKVDVPAAAAATGGREAVLADQAKSNEASVVVAGTGHTTQGNDSMKVKEHAAGDVAVAAPPAAPQVDDVVCPGASVASMELDKHVEVGDATTVSKEEKAAADDSMKVKEQAAGDVAVAAPLATPQVDDVACPGSSVASMELDKHAEVGDATILAKEDKAAADDSMKVKEQVAGDLAVAAPPATSQVDDVECPGASVAPMKFDKHAEVGDATAVVEEEKVAANDSMKVKELVAGDVAVASPPATPQVDDSACAGASVASMKLDKHAEIGDTTAVAEEEKAAADVNSLATSQGKEGVVAPPAWEVKIQVEGKMCTTVVRQAGGSLSCGLCGVHGCDKDGILQHLYNRAHCVRDRRLAEEKTGRAGLAATANNLGTGNC